MPDFGGGTGGGQVDREGRDRGGVEKWVRVELDGERLQRVRRAAASAGLIMGSTITSVTALTGLMHGIVFLVAVFPLHSVSAHNALFFS